MRKSVQCSTACYTRLSVEDRLRPIGSKRQRVTTTGDQRRLNECNPLGICSWEIYRDQVEVIVRRTSARIWTLQPRVVVQHTTTTWHLQKYLELFSNLTCFSNKTARLLSQVARSGWSRPSDFSPISIARANRESASA